MDGFPNDTRALRATLVRTLELMGLTDEAQLVRTAEIGISDEGHDNWNGGIDYYGINLRIPLERFVAIEPGAEEVEKAILRAAQTLWRGEEREQITKVLLYPALLSVDGSAAQPPLGIQPLPHYWTPGFFRLFLSHCSSCKAEVAGLQRDLESCGVAAFVAHTDIEPTKEWINEIERALQSMEALAAILTTDFQASRWCDQEVGFALGCGRLVIPVRVHVDPYGFLGKYQALAVRGPLASVAAPLCEILVRHDLTKVSMTNALVVALGLATSWERAKSIMSILEQAPSITMEHAKRIVGAVSSNAQVRDAFGVPGRIRALVSQHGHATVLG